MPNITANQLKTKGVSVIQSSLKSSDEAIITVRGKEKYVVVNIDHYNYLRECELEAALNSVKKDYENKNYVTESVEDHIKRVTEWTSD